MIVPICNGLGSVIARSWANPYTRRTSCHKRGNRYAACRVMLAPFLLKTPPLRKSRARPPLRSRHTIPARTPSSNAILQSSTSCARFCLDTQRRIPLYCSHLKVTSYHTITITHNHKPNFPGGDHGKKRFEKIARKLRNRQPDQHGRGNSSWRPCG
jgi:hypothetical protein